MTSTLEARFREFFACANARPEADEGPQPYPWQVALMTEVAETGKWPDIDAPTGSGKSSVVDIHAFLVAQHALGRIAARPPRRLILVAPRRVLVDDQYERALALRARLADALTGEAGGAGAALTEVAAALDGLCTAASSPAAPLGVWRLRGGIRLEPGWRLEPAACQIICATPLMWGSRLLLRGYGSSTKARNLETGLLAHDAVAVIDEAHLHQRLVATATDICRRQDGATQLQAISMTATAPPSTARQVSLTAEDTADAGLSRRITATKRVVVVEIDDFGSDAWREVASQATSVKADTPGTVGVFVNDVASALKVAREVGRSGVVELVCGRMRPADVALLRERRPGLLDSRGNPAVDFLVSTQSLEVGVDLDLEAMVTMLASPTALAQRAGRLNRSGRHGDSVLAVIAPRTSAEAGYPERSGPYSREDLLDGARWLADLDGSISPIEVLRAGVPSQSRPTLPALRASDLQTLAFTSDAQSADPDPDLYLEDPEVRAPEIQIAARKHLDLETEVVADILRACPPRAHELVTLPLGKDLDRILERVAETAWIVRSRGADLVAIPLAGTLEPGDTLVVPDGALICTAGIVGLFAPRGSSEPIRDVLAHAPDEHVRDSIVALPAEALADIIQTEPTLGSRAARMNLAAVLHEEGHGALAERLRRHRRLADIEVQWSAGVAAETGLLLVSDMSQHAVESPLIVPEAPVTLDRHQRAVAGRLQRLISHLESALAPHERDALLLAAQCHDDGKAHPRFQRRMGAADGALLAKPAPGHRADRGDGWRHEQLSAAYAAALSDNDPLVVALVAAHHGRGRPLFDRNAAALLDGWDTCPPDVRQHADVLFGPRGRYEVLRARADDQTGIFRLAWLEALLRCADMQVSREGS